MMIYDIKLRCWVIAVLSEPEDEDFHDTHCLIMRHKGIQQHCIGSIATILSDVLFFNVLTLFVPLLFSFAKLPIGLL